MAFELASAQPLIFFPMCSIGGSRTAATSKELHLGCCSSPRSASCLSSCFLKIKAGFRIRMRKTRNDIFANLYLKNFVHKL